MKFYYLVYAWRRGLNTQIDRFESNLPPYPGLRIVRRGHTWVVDKVELNPNQDGDDTQEHLSVSVWELPA